MDVNIANMAVNAGGFNWGELWSGLFPAIIGGFISGLITLWAVKSTNKENREMWQKDSFVKYVNECRIDFYKKLARTLDDSEAYIVDCESCHACILSDEDLNKLPDSYKFLKEEIELHKDFYCTLEMKDLTLNDIEEELKQLHLFFHNKIEPSRDFFWINRDRSRSACRLISLDDAKKSIEIVKRFRDCLVKIFL